MATAVPELRIDVAINELLRHFVDPVTPMGPRGATLPEPVFPQYPELIDGRGPPAPPEQRHWIREHIMRKVRGWVIPYIGAYHARDFHPITAYLSITNVISIAGTVGHLTIRSKE